MARVMAGVQGSVMVVLLSAFLMASCSDCGIRRSSLGMVGMGIGDLRFTIYDLGMGTDRTDPTDPTDPTDEGSKGARQIARGEAGGIVEPRAKHGQRVHGRESGSA